jgi:hypothetical protein
MVSHRVLRRSYLHAAALRQTRTYSKCASSVGALQLFSPVVANECLGVISDEDYSRISYMSFQANVPLFTACNIWIRSPFHPGKKAK